MDAGLSHYIVTSRQQGYSDMEIRQSLISAGWDGFQVDDAFQVMARPVGMNPLVVPKPVATSHPAHMVESASPMVDTAKPRRSFKKPLIIAGASLGGILVLLAGTVSASEMGFLPALSRVYRASTVPVVWGGTTGKPEVALLQVLKAMDATKRVTLTSDWSMTVERSGSKSATRSDPLANLVSTLFSRNTPTILAQVEEDSGDVDLTIDESTVFSEDSFSAEEATPVGAFNPDAYLPLTISGTLNLEEGNDDTSSLEGTIDFGNLLTKAPELSSLVPSVKNPTTFAGKVNLNTKKAYAKTNIFPYLSAADEGKFLGFTLSSEVLDSLKKSETLESQYNALSADEKKKLIDTINLMISDKGVERHNGRPAAHYALTINNAVLKNIAELNGEAYTAVANESTTDSRTDIWIDQFTHQILTVRGSGTTTYSGGYGISVNSSGSMSLDYSKPATVIMPLASQVVAKSGEEYIQEMIDAFMGSETGATDF